MNVQLSSLESDDQSTSKQQFSELLLLSFENLPSKVREVDAVCRFSLDADAVRSGFGYKRPRLGLKIGHG